MDSGKFCPLLLLGKGILDSHRAFESQLCLKEACAWWRWKEGNCAVVDLVAAIDQWRREAGERGI